MTLRSNSRFSEFSNRLQSRGDLAVAWEGEIFRATSLSRPGPAEILSGEGSYRMGGRWNARNSFRAVYGSVDDTTAVAESRSSAAYYKVKFTKNRLLVVVRLQLGKVLDLTSAGVRRKVVVTLSDIISEDWRKLNDQGYESLTQALGRAAEAAGIEAMIVPSVFVKGGVNVVFLPRNLAVDSNAEVLNADELERLPRKDQG